jgi:phosphate transport system substrate-binding protein
MMSFLKRAALVAVMGIAPAAMGQNLSGEVKADGSSTVYPLAEAIAESFGKENPGVRVTVGIAGTGGGFKRFTKGETDISDASRPIKKEEAEAAKSNGVEYIEVPVAYDGLSVVVNKSNDWAKQLTVDQLKKLFTTNARSWKDIDPSFPDVPIKIYSPGTDSGTYDYMKEVVATKEAPMRKDMELSEDDNVLVRGVEGDRGAIGYFGSAYYFANKDSINAVAIVNKKGQAVKPTPETIKDGSYNPLSRPLFIYVNTKSLSRPEVKAFVDHFLDNAGEAAAKVGYVALPDEVYDRAEANVKSGKTGSQYLGPDGKHKEGPVTEIYR